MTWSGVDGGLLAWESFSAWRIRAVGTRVMLPQALCCTRVSALHVLCVFSPCAPVTYLYHSPAALQSGHKAKRKASAATL